MPHSVKETIKDAAKKKRVLRLAYRDLKGNTSIRNVEPYELRGNRIYAYCRKRKSIRQFDLSRISSAKMTHYAYLPKYPIRMNETLTKTASVRLALATQWFGPFDNAPLD